MTTRVRSTIEGVHFAERTVLSVTLGVFFFFLKIERVVSRKWKLSDIPCFFFRSKATIWSKWMTCLLLSLLYLMIL